MNSYLLFFFRYEIILYLDLNSEPPTRDDSDSIGNKFASCTTIINNSNTYMHSTPTCYSYKTTFFLKIACIC